MAARPGKLIVLNKKQALKVKLASWVLMLASIAIVYAAFTIFNSWGISPADGGQLKPFNQRLIFSGSLLIMAMSIVAGIIYYRHIYVISISRNGDILQITTSLHKTPLTLNPADITSSSHHSGQMTVMRSSGVISVNAPWIILKTTNPTRHFLIDAQSEILDVAAIKKLVRD